MDKLSESASTPCKEKPAFCASTSAETVEDRGIPTRPNWTIHICPTTGGQFDIHISPLDTIECVKRLISKRLKISKERISLLHKDRLLKDGSLMDNGIMEGGKITLLPNVESGLISQRQENSVMQALENLSEPQVNDFLAGKSPLTLAMRLGDHMMFVQLQLSTSQSGSKRTTTSTSSSSSKHRSTKHIASSGTTTRLPPHLLQQTPIASRPPATHSFINSSKSLPPQTLLTSSNVTQRPPTSPLTSSTADTTSTPNVLPSTNPHKAAPYVLPPSAVSYPMPPSGTQTGIPPGLVVPKPVKLEKVPVLDSAALVEASRNLSQKLKELSAVSSNHINRQEMVRPKKQQQKPRRTSSSSTTTPSAAATSTHHGTTASAGKAEGSKAGCSGPARDAQGAIIESMHHHGQGVYSGTFSGTLNPALQDKNGKPRKSVSTIIHILNDLLGASPQYRAQLARQHRHEQRQAERMARAMHKSQMKSSREQIRHLENRATKGKMEQLQMMMRERQERRKARREARASPYMTSWSSGTSQLSQMPSLLKSSGSSEAMEVDANVGTSNVAENVPENNGYTQIKTETVVA